MADYTSLIIIGAFLVVFPLMWFLITRLLMKIAGMQRNVDTSVLGARVKSFGTGSARIRGINFSNALIVDRHEHGYFMRVWKILGGGQMAVPDSEIVSVSRSRTFFVMSTLMTLRNGRSIRFFGRLGRSVAAVEA